ncbi:MAG: [FeFe] hydrogenase H-cluster radical SAM maturase HydG [Armatimonadota bacterium]|jgi:2-iminoacetate synthase
MTTRDTKTDHIIDEDAITRTLGEARAPDEARLRDLLDSARSLGGLSLAEAAELMLIDDPGHLEEIFETARAIKQRIYGNRIVLFAPLYISNECVGNCLYCSFRRDNTGLDRRTLDTTEIRRETRWLVEHGYKRLLLVFGDHPHNDVEQMIAAIEACYSVRVGEHDDRIRRVNVNAAPLSREEFERLQPAGLGTFQVFQETYHRATYEGMHPVGPKADYDRRLSVWDRCLPAGIDDMGLGVLYGLYDWRWDTLALLAHAEYLMNRYRVGPHTISVPRLEPALGSEFSTTSPWLVGDDDFKKLVAIIRMAVPYTGMILTTRERPEFRRELMEIGFSQVSAGSKTSPGGYTEHNPDEDDTRQFELGDHRGLDEVMLNLCQQGYLPSFCTACYRSGRTGEHFMELAKPGEIQTFCLPNALISFKEYLLDYAGPETIAEGERIIAEHIGQIESEAIRQRTEEKLRRTEQGERDLYI